MRGIKLHAQGPSRPQGGSGGGGKQGGYLPPSSASFLPVLLSFCSSWLTSVHTSFFPSFLLAFLLPSLPLPSFPVSFPRTTPHAPKKKNLRTDSYQAAAKPIFGNVIQPTSQLNEPWLSTAQTPCQKRTKDHAGRDAMVNPLERQVACARYQSFMINCHL